MSWGGWKSDSTEVIKVNLLCCQVCSRLSEDAALEEIQKHYAAGTTNNWQISERENHHPVKCNDNSDRHHYMFTC